MRASDGRRTPPGSPPNSRAAIAGETSTRRRSSGFLYQTVIGNPDALSNASASRSNNGVPLQRQTLSNGSKLIGPERGDLPQTKTLLERKNEEIQKLRKELDDAKTEITRRTSQARLFRESENQLKLSAESRRVEMEDLKAQLSEKLKQAKDFETKEKQLKSDIDRLTKENDQLKRRCTELSEELTRFRSGTANFLAETASEGRKSDHVLALEAELLKQKEQLSRLEKLIADGSKGGTPELVLRITLPGGRTEADLIITDVSNFGLIDQNIRDFARQHKLGPRSMKILRQTVARERHTMLAF